MIEAISFATLGFSAMQTLTLSISVQSSKVVHFNGKGKPVVKLMNRRYHKPRFSISKMGSLTLRMNNKNLSKKLQ